MISSLSLSVVILIPFAFIIWIILSFTEKRQSTHIDLCDGRPGIVVPINFLTPRYRVAYSLACSAQCSLWLELLSIALNIDIGVNKFLDVIFKGIVLIGLVFLVTLITYPMVACVDAPIPMVGYVLGLVYSLLFFILSVYELISSLLDLDGDAFYYALFVTGIIPQGFCLVGIIGWYCYRIYKKIRIIVKKDHYSESDLPPSWFKALLQPKTMTLKNQKYVKRLFKEKTKRKLSFCAAIRCYLQRIDLPLSLIIAATVSTVIILQLTIVAAFIYPIILTLISEIIFENADDNFKRSIQAISVIGPLLSAGISLGLLGHLLYSVQNQINKLRKGQGSLIPYIRDRITPLKLASSARYAGYQTASFITGFLFYTIVLILIGFFIVLVRFSPDSVGYILYILVMTGLTIGGILFTQYMVCKFAFLRSPENKKKGIVFINNRKLFESYMYFTLLYSIATGLFTSTLRILTAITLTLLVKPRLDRLVFISPFQKLDTGHAMYRSFMIVEAHLHNPTVNYFVQIMLETSTRSVIATGRRSRTRWHLAYTLIKNPDLITERKQQLQQHVDNDVSADDSNHWTDTVTNTDYHLYEHVNFLSQVQK